ncbi:TPX2 [Macleaya cordata]|uniref:TPX2 n=1 Tax=Macleaya cordata TaxID=56857 RepID=A0A200QN53_MACCD|nr:TPX2 [Macleaya cordata]
MAGEIEEPISFQSSSVHSGSISFGRFEDEPLSWERRSSFSHNRYLEEVEKYSTPGSVTQKKAYFEAHFKKKALLRQASECQDGIDSIEYQTSDNDLTDHISYMEEFEHSNEGAHYEHYDESQYGSDDHGECEVMGCEREGEEISPEFQMESTVNNPDAVCHSDSEHVEPSELHENQIECTTLQLVKDEPEEEEKQMLAHETENLDELPRSNDSLPKCLTTGKDHKPCMNKSENSSRKVTATEETQTVKANLKTQLAVAEGTRKISSETSKDSARNSRKVEREGPLRTKPEKLSRQKVPSNTFAQPKTLKPEDSETLKAKQSQENKSRKDQRAKSAGSIPRSSAPDKGESRSRQIVNRPKQTVNPTKQDIKLNGPIFKSDERAEKRKEFYMKLEEKMHAKEAEMNQIQARTQEETEAEIKQFRRSLNFKATPMPSFYQEAVSRGSDAKKALSTHAKATKSRSQSTSPGSRVAARSSAFSKSGHKHGITLNESMRTPAQPQTSEATKCLSETDNSSQNPSVNKTRTIQTAKRTESAGKKEREKGKDSSVQKHQGPESSKVKKGERVEGKRVVAGVGRNNSSEMMRKMKKDIAIGSNSRMDRLSVDVAS